MGMGDGHGVEIGEGITLCVMAVRASLPTPK